MNKTYEELSDELHVCHERIADLESQVEQHRVAEEMQIKLREKADEREAALAAYQDDLVQELAACQAVLHNLAHDRQVTPDYANDAKAVLKRKPATSLARRDARMKAEGVAELIDRIPSGCDFGCRNDARRLRDEYLEKADGGV